MTARYAFTSTQRITPGVGLRWDTDSTSGIPATVYDSGGNLIDPTARQPIQSGDGAVPTVYADAPGTLYVRQLGFRGVVLPGVLATVTSQDTYNPPIVGGGGGGSGTDQTARDSAAAANTAAAAAQGTANVVQAAVTAIRSGAPADLDQFAEVLIRFLANEAAATALNTRVSGTESTISTILSGSTPDKDSFAEIAALIVANSNALAALPATYVTVVQHSSTAGTARPAAAVRVYWRGSVSPTNAAQFDRWLDTSRSDGVLVERVNVAPTGQAQTWQALSVLPATLHTTTAAGAALTLDDPVSATSDCYDITLTADCAFTFPAPAACRSITLRLTQDATGGRKVTWPASVKWPQAIAPVLSTGGTKQDVLTFVSISGAAWSGFLAGLDLR